MNRFCKTPLTALQKMFKGLTLFQIKPLKTLVGAQGLEPWTR